MTSQGTVNTLTVSGFTSAIQRANGQADLSNWELSNGKLTPIECHPHECTVAETNPNLYYFNNKTLTDNTGDIREKGTFNSHNCNHPACTPFYYSAKHHMMGEAAREALNTESIRQGISVDPSRWKLVSVKLFPEITLTNVESLDLNDSREASEVAHGKPCNSLLTFGVFDKEGLSSATEMPLAVEASMHLMTVSVRNLFGRPMLEAQSSQHVSHTSVAS